MTPTPWPTLWRQTELVFAPRLGEREYELAAEAYANFGNGRHPTALNMDDCFSYACAKSVNATLLFKGTDFSNTDMVIS